MIDVSKSSATKATQAYRLLRKAIVQGDIPAETSLDEAQLIAEFGTGRTPLREAIKRLASEQLVVWPAHRTPFVRAVEVSDLHSLSEARLLLEEPTAALAAARITADEGVEVRAVCLALKEATEAGDIYATVELDHQFHLAIAQASHNRFLIESVKITNCGSLRLWYLTNKYQGLGGVHERHYQIAIAILSGDPAAAAQSMRTHILNSQARQLEMHRLAGR